ncbi:TraR/DksA family transcriptional regulator [Streptomyces microflavus]|uniref:TraR/DksA C4-type zinc finger protein n=1 Tax=Streptomyces microflavus TaxID=1919 RepID=A0ABV1Q5K7_STRMI|nr:MULTISPECIES: TraR/DksA C4-type zinc finger protein [Streptomyces]MBW3358112.1 TraR/DksA C4-type zinc finger protein [Streptomyces sp. 09ZI22]MEE1733468.1 TraR/DksA C4-type zinc finger protein [Streptomyces sp. BE282]OXY87123.1 DNA-binding protein [Streptomyces sp. 2R]QQZ53592.1 TraR/DksA C4-type zinc finger protein [Streptomyces microflavus]QTA31418.1 DNA-binding protein [Streptomyces sp. CA-256286]
MVAKKTAEETAAGQKADGKPPADETSPDEAAAEKAPAKKTAAKKTAGRKAAAKKAPTKKAAAKKTAAKKSTTSTTKKSAAKKASKTAAQTATGAAAAAEETGAHTVVAKKSASRPAAGREEVAVPPARAAATAPGELAVRPGEDPWTPEEVTEARTLLTSETMRLRSELEASGAALAGLMRDSGDGAGDDEADTGTKNITREHELSLAANAQEMLEQTERALARLEAGTYGLCEICGKPIGKARMQAFPRATLCVEDKQKQERRG